MSTNMFKYLSNIYQKAMFIRWSLGIGIYMTIAKKHTILVMSSRWGLLCGVFPFFVEVNPYAVLYRPVGAKDKTL